MKNSAFVAFVILVVLLIQLTEFTFLFLTIRSNVLESILNEKQQQQLFLAKQISLSLQTDIHGVQDKLELLAQQPALVADPASCQKELQKASDILYLKVGNVARLDKNATVDCSLDLALLKTNGMKRSHIKQIFEDPRHEAVFSPMILSTVHKGMTSVMHVPLFTRAGVFVGTLGAPIYFNELKEKYLKNLLLDRKSYLTIVDANGDILYDRDAKNVGKNIFSSQQSANLYSLKLSEVVKKALSEKEGYTAIKAGKQQYIEAFATAEVFKNRKWIVILSTSTDDIISQLDSRNGFAGMSAFVTFLVSFIFILLTAKLFLFFFIKSLIKR